jgi:hypothetical protein
MDAANLLDDPIFVGVMSHKWRTGVSFQGRRCFGALDVFEHAQKNTDLRLLHVYPLKNSSLLPSSERRWIGSKNTSVFGRKVFR